MISSISIDVGENGRCSCAEQLQSRPPSAAVMHASSRSSSLEEATTRRPEHPSSIRRHLKHVPLSNPRFSMASFSSAVPLFLPFLSTMPALPVQLPTVAFHGFHPFSTWHVIILRFLATATMSSITDRRFSRRQLAATGRPRKNTTDTCHLWKT